MELIRNLLGRRPDLISSVVGFLKDRGDLDEATMHQFAAEFQPREKGAFDKFMDGVNRLPRPFLVFSVIAMLVYTVIDPLAMARVFASWALIPTGLWAILSVIVAFYFNGREQLKNQDFQAQMVEAAARVPAVVNNVERLRDLDPDRPGAAADVQPGAAGAGDNPALTDWSGEQY